MNLQRWIGNYLALRRAMVVAMFLGCAVAAFGVPGKVTIQGKLTGVGGKALSGTRAWKVTFYNAPSGAGQLGAALSGTVALAVSGRFVIDVTPPPAALAATGDLYYELGIDSALIPDGAVGPGDVFPGRVKVGSVMWSQQAGEAVRATSATLAVRALAADAASTASYAAQAGDALRLGGVAAVDYVTSAILGNALSGKADLNHGHALQSLEGAVTDDQVPDTITVEYAGRTRKALEADWATTASFALAAVETDTLESVAARGAMTSQSLQIVNPMDSVNTTSGALVVAGGAAIGKNLHVGGNLYFAGSKAFAWEAAAGLAVQAQPNSGYYVTTSALTTITLPPAPRAGETVRVCGTGAGGWKIAQNAGQKILLEGLNVPYTGTAWLARESSRAWTSIASSIDGLKLVACVNGGQLYTSVDGGITWTARENSRSWTGVASSADGTRLYACCNSGIFASRDSGATWTVKYSAASPWVSISCSADGQRVAACSNGGSLPQVSQNGGDSWYAMNATSGSWSAVAVSGDGSKLVLAGIGMQVWISYDFGSNFFGRAMNAPWKALAVSSNGSRMAACYPGGLIWISYDSGSNWGTYNASNNWSGLAMSPDGQKILACVVGGPVHLTTNGGGNWSTLDTARNWSGVATSADGSRLAGCTNGSQIFTYSSALLSTSLGTDGYLAGGKNCSVELLHVGGGAFLPVSMAGALNGR